MSIQIAECGLLELMAPVQRSFDCKPCCAAMEDRFTIWLESRNGGLGDCWVLSLQDIWEILGVVFGVGVVDDDVLSIFEW